MTFDLQRAVTGLVASPLLKILKGKKKDFPFVCEFSVYLFTFFSFSHFKMDECKQDFGVVLFCHVQYFFSFLF